MITLLTLTVLCLGGVVVGSVLIALVLTLIGLPLAILFSLLPWLLRLAGVVLLIKGVLDQPFRWENLIPAALAFALSGVLRWLF